MKFIVLFLIVLAILIRIPFLNREFTLEEAFHVRAAKTVAETGYPLVYYGEQQPLTIYLDRPPGLLLALATSFKFWGVSEISARIIPLVFFLGQLVLMIYFGKKLFASRFSFAMILILILFVIHPYIIQNSLQLHFDGAIFPFFSTFYLFLALFKIAKRENRWHDHILLGIILFLAFWVKYEPSLVMVILVTVFALFYKRFFLRKFIVATMIVSFAYLASFYFYNMLLGHPEGFWLPFERVGQLSATSYLPKISSLDWLNHPLATWSGSYYIAIRFLSWLSVPTILLVIYTFVRFFQEKKVRTDPKLVFLVLWTLTFIGIYFLVGWAGDYPRYFQAAMPPLFLLSGIIVNFDFAKYKRGLDTKSIFYGLILLLVIIFYLEKNQYLFLNHITGWIPSLQVPFAILIAVGTCAILAASITKKYLLTVIILILFLNFYQIAAQYTHDLKSNFSLTNFYGNGGYREAGRFLRDHLHANDIILTFDPVGYYWGGRFYDYYPLGPYRAQNYKEIMKALETNQVAAVALPKEYFWGEFLAIEKFDLASYVRNRFKNYKNFGGDNGIEIWYSK